MILKFKINEKQFAFHDADEVLVNGEYLKRGEGNYIEYSQTDTAKQVSFKLKGELKVINYSYCELLNNEGKVICNL